jgi:hypothetical protein
MTKNILLAAAAVSALGFAGAAHAQVITTAEVSNIAVKAPATPSTPYAIANESFSSVANRRTTTTAGENVVAFTTVADAKLEAGTVYRVNYTLSGTATPTFLAQVTSSALTATNAGATCAVTTSVVAGTGAGGSNTVSFLVTTPGAAVAADCPSAFAIDLPYGIGTIGTVSATVSGSLDSSNTNPAANPNRFTAAGATSQLVQAAAGYRLFADATVDGVTGDGVDNADRATVLALEASGQPFRSFVAAGDKIIGAAGLVTAAAPVTSTGTVYANLAAAPLPAASYTLSISPTSGDFSVLKPQVGTDDATFVDATVAANNLSATAGTSGAPLTGARNVGLRIDGAPTASIASTPQTYTVNVTAVAPAATGADAALVTLSARSLTNQALETVGLQGTTFVAPWVQSSNASYNTVMRVSNNGGTATGAVQLTIASPLAAPTRATCTAAELPKLASVPANGELAINSADLTTCFGAFTRGDVSLTVLSLSSNLTAKLRIVSPGGVVSEQSLGRYSGTYAAN